MHLATIRASKQEAVKKLKEYRKATSPEDLATLRIYRHLARGRRVIDVWESIREAGTDDAGRPKLALARASWHVCWYFCHRGFCRYPGAFRRLNTSSRSIIQTADLALRGYSSNIRALVPLIPPDLRPRSITRNHYILWEAEWKHVPPRDPFLLLDIDGRNMAVLAQWDLTEVERAVLRQRR